MGHIFIWPKLHKMCPKRRPTKYALDLYMRIDFSSSHSHDTCIVIQFRFWIISQLDILIPEKWIFFVKIINNVYYFRNTNFLFCRYLFKPFFSKSSQNSFHQILSKLFFSKSSQNSFLANPVKLFSDNPVNNNQSNNGSTIT